MKWRSEEVRVPGLEAGVVAAAPASHEDRPRWFVVTRDGMLRGVDLDDGATFFSVKLPFSVEPALTIVASPSGAFVAVVQTHGTNGALYGLAMRQLVRGLTRGDYHPEVSEWAIALEDDRLYFATDWNRLEVWELPSCVRLQPAGAETGFDYFYGRAALSPSKKWLATFGWHWHPIGALNVVDLETWRARGEAEDGRPSMAPHALYAEWWDASVCFLDDRRVALIGDARKEPDEDDILQTQRGLLLYDFVSSEHTAFFPGLLARELAFDGARLILIGDTTRAVSVADGAVLATLEAKAVAWHPGNRTVLSLEPLAQHWLGGTEPEVRRELPRGTSAAELSVFADALEEQGGDAAAIAHLRSGHRHGRRCWVLEAHRR